MANSLFSLSSCSFTFVNLSCNRNESNNMLTHPSSKYACFQRGRVAENICVAGDTVHITVYFIRTNVYFNVSSSSLILEGKPTRVDVSVALLTRNLSVVGSNPRSTATVVTVSKKHYPHC